MTRSEWKLQTDNLLIPQILSFLQAHLKTSLYLYTNIKATENLCFSEGTLYSAQYFTLQDENDNFIGIIAHCWNGNILLQCPNPLLIASFNSPSSSSAVLSRAVAMVLGEYDQVRALMAVVPSISQHYCRAECMYELDLSDFDENIEYPADLRVGLAEMEDLPVLSQLHPTFVIENIAPSADYADQLVKSTAFINTQFEAKTLFCAKTKSTNQHVAMGVYSAMAAREMVQIGAVYVPAVHRGKKISYYVVMAALREAKARGFKRSVLFTQNPAAMKVYEKIGYTRMKDKTFALTFKTKPTV